MIVKSHKRNLRPSVSCHWPKQIWRQDLVFKRLRPNPGTSPVECFIRCIEKHNKRLNEV